MAESTKKRARLAEEQRPHEHVWSMAELVIKIAEHLAQERIDLLTLSLVSRRCRTLAWQVLVRNLVVPLSRVHQITAFFEQHRQLIRHIKRLRVIDDVRMRHFCRRFDCPTPRLHDSPWHLKRNPKTGDIDTEAMRRSDRPPVPIWANAIGFFQLLGAERGADSALLYPDLDFSLGQDSATEFNKDILSIEHVAPNIVALRTFVDDDMSMEDRMKVGVARRWFRMRGERWNAIGHTVAALSHRLRLLHIQDFTRDVAERDALTPETWTKIAKGAASSVEDLVVHWSRADMKQLEPLRKPIFNRPWPKLRSFELADPLHGAYHYAPDLHRGPINDFLERNPQLEHISLKTILHRPLVHVGHFPHTSSSLPHLTTYEHGPTIRLEDYIDMLQRHPKIQSWTLERAGAPRNTSCKDVAARLHTIRAPLSEVAHLIQLGARPVQLCLTQWAAEAEAPHLDTFEHPYHPPPAPSALRLVGDAITALELSWMSLSPDWDWPRRVLVPLLGHRKVQCAGRITTLMPNLVELALCARGRGAKDGRTESAAPEEGAEGERGQEEEEEAKHQAIQVASLATLLGHLSDATKLEVVRIESPLLRPMRRRVLLPLPSSSSSPTPSPFPSAHDPDTNTNTEADTDTNTSNIPPKLRYVTLHAPLYNSMRHYRVMRRDEGGSGPTPSSPPLSAQPPASPPPPPQQQQQGTRIRTRTQVVELEELPPSFSHWVDERAGGGGGVWHHLGPHLPSHECGLFRHVGVDVAREAPRYKWEVSAEEEQEREQGEGNQSRRGGRPVPRLRPRSLPLYPS